MRATINFSWGGKFRNILYFGRTRIHPITVLQTNEGKFNWKFQIGGMTSYFSANKPKDAKIYIEKSLGIYRD